MEAKAQYSVLMSVYYKEKPEFLKTAMESIYRQTIPTQDFVLVCDGPLTEALDEVIEHMGEQFGERLHVIRLEENKGLGNALKVGLAQCRYDLVARMDSDDISAADRCEKQLEAFARHPELSILSGTVSMFAETPERITGKRELPETHEQIVRFSKKRSPFNHPVVMFRKQSVEQAGGYDNTYPYLEDYYLWVRMLQKGCISMNLKESLLWMRAPADLYARRGGAKYARNLLRFHWWVHKIGWAGIFDFLFGAVPHALVCVLPNFMRVWVYKILHK